jgi:UDP-GlcNAc:undecaprenyl-phosphate GlcNAc-1-phosphate transferase
MDSWISPLFLAIFLGISVTFLTAPAAIYMSRRVGLVDVPGSSSHKKHKTPTVLAGGTALFLSFLLLALALGLFKDRNILALFVAVSIIYAFGLWDDLKGLDAPKKLLGQGLASVVIMASGISIQIFEAPTFFIGGPEMIYVLVDRALTVFWLIGITNAFNLVDSMDGLAVGISGWTLAFFMLITIDTGQVNLATLSALLAGICLTLYLFNSPKARLFMGDSGVQTLGFTIAVMSILLTPVNNAQTTSWFIPILLLAIPIFDTSLVFFSRLRRGVAFYKSGYDHTYHRLTLLGLESNHAVLLLHTIALAIDCLAYFAMSLGPLWANVIFAGLVVVALAAFVFLEVTFTTISRRVEAAAVHESGLH